MSKQAGRMSQSSNDFLAPYAPTIGTATDVGTGRAYNNGAVTVTFTADPINVATSFTATASTGQTVTGASSPLTLTGFASEAVATITVTATNDYGTSPASAASNSVTVTTVPAQPAAPGASSPSGTSYDTVTWTAPANGGKAITNYYVYSSDGKPNNTASTSINVNQEAGTAQTYNVRADNANGSSVTSAESGSVTTFSFVPFSVFGFSPFNVFGFSPTPPFGVFGFSPTPPFGVFGFSPTPPFGVFGFSPVAFGVFGFSPTPPSFSVFGFSPSPRCIDQDTPIATVGLNGAIVMKAAKAIIAGDEVYAAKWAELEDESFGTPFDDPSATLTNPELVVTTISSVQASTRSTTVYFNNNMSKRFSLEEQILVKRDGYYQFVVSGQVLVGDVLIEMSNNSFAEAYVTDITLVNEDRVVYTFDCEPTDTLIAGNIIVHNAKAF
jgi:hypothetical protein